MVRRATIAHNCTILLNKTSKTSSCRMTRGNYSSALIHPGGGEGTTLKYRQNAIRVKVNSRVLLFFWADITTYNCILWLKNMSKSISCSIKWGNYSSALIPPGGGRGNYFKILVKCKLVNRAQWEFVLLGVL